MGKERHIVLEQQGIWDLAIQCYGSVEGVFALLQDNELATGLDTALTPGQVLEVTTPAFDNEVKTYYRTSELHPVTGATTPMGGEFSDDFNEDFFI